MKNSFGFTLIEMIVVVSIITTLLGFITINLVRSHRSTSLASIGEVLAAELRQQQLKSMIGDTEGRSVSDSYGIHFDSDKYVVFHGSSYSSNDTSNAITNLGENMQFNNAGYNIIFSKLSGEITSALIIELQDNTNSQSKRIHLNRYGVITQIESL